MLVASLSHQQCGVLRVPADDTARQHTLEEAGVTAIVVLRCPPSVHYCKVIRQMSEDLKDTSLRRSSYFSAQPQALYQCLLDEGRMQ